MRGEPVAQGLQLRRRRAERPSEPGPGSARGACPRWRGPAGDDRGQISQPLVAIEHPQETARASSSPLFEAGRPGSGLSEPRKPAARPGPGRTAGLASEDVALELVELVEHRLDDPFVLGRLDQALRRSGAPLRPNRRPRPGLRWSRHALASAIRLSLRGRWHAPAAGSSLIAASSSRDGRLRSAPWRGPGRRPRRPYRRSSPRFRRGPGRGRRRCRAGRAAWPASASAWAA